MIERDRSISRTLVLLCQLDSEAIRHLEGGRPARKRRVRGLFRSGGIQREVAKALAMNASTPSQCIYGGLWWYSSK